MLKQLHDPGMPVVIVPEPISTQNKQLAKWVAHEVHVPAATTTQATASFFLCMTPFWGMLWYGLACFGRLYPMKGWLPRCSFGICENFSLQNFVTSILDLGIFRGSDRSK